MDLMGQKRSETEPAVHLLFLMITLADCCNGVGCHSVFDLESLAHGWTGHSIKAECPHMRVRSRVPK